VGHDVILDKQDILFNDQVVVNIPGNQYLWRLENFTVSGRNPGTVEDLTEFINLAVRFRVTILIKGNLKELDCNRRFPDKDIDGMLKWAHELSKKNPEQLNWEELLGLSIVHVFYERGYFHYWRQVRDNLKKVNKPMLDSYVKMTIELLYCTALKYNLIQSSDSFQPQQQALIQLLKPIILFDVSVKYSYKGIQWFINSYDPDIKGSINIVLGNKIIIELKISDSLELNHRLLAHLKSSIASDTKLVVDPITLVLIPNLGIVYQSNLKLDPQASPWVSVEQELIYRAIRRKLNLQFDTNDMTETYNILKKQKISPEEKNYMIQFIQNMNDHQFILD